MLCSVLSWLSWPRRSVGRQRPTEPNTAPSAHLGSDRTRKARTAEQRCPVCLACRALPCRASLRTVPARVRMAVSPAARFGTPTATQPCGAGKRRGAQRSAEFSRFAVRGPRSVASGHVAVPTTDALIGPPPCLAGGQSRARPPRPLAATRVAAVA